MRTVTTSTQARTTNTAFARIVFAGFLSLCTIAGGRAEADAAIAIETLIPFSERSEIRDSIRQDCGLSTKLSRAIGDRAADSAIALERVGNRSKQGIDHNLELRITDAIKTGGGVFPTSSISIDGVLKKDGKVVGTFVATRFASASLNPFRRSECAVLSVAVNALARDVVKWLKAPRLDSRIGDAR